MRNDESVQLGASYSCAWPIPVTCFDEQGRTFTVTLPPGCEFVVTSIGADGSFECAFALRITGRAEQASFRVVA